MSHVVPTLREAVFRRISPTSRSEDAAPSNTPGDGLAGARMFGAILLASALFWLLLLGAVALCVWR